MGGQRHAPAALPPGKTRYLLYGRLGGPQGLYERARKNSSPPGIDPQTVKSVTSRYTDYTIVRKVRNKNIYTHVVL
jgi:hypothetical protein